ncbi:hypothetical protein ZEAMMB73_Zm00001d039095 [Zea mays]|uniref:Uncharacterized protein n=1 Tax=Zea mays TaxID=4577 RepID=A0A1D6MDJ2_MAIZE|nr:hypothetical protein ZEAMMB73_Zm00001d039095 [Zea mays]
MGCNTDWKLLFFYRENWKLLLFETRKRKPFGPMLNVISLFCLKIIAKEHKHFGRHL